MDVKEIQEELRGEVLAEIDAALARVALRRARAQLAAIEAEQADIDAEVEKLRPEAEQADQATAECNDNWRALQFGGGQVTMAREEKALAARKAWQEAKSRAAALWQPIRDLWQRQRGQETRDLEAMVRKLEQVERPKGTALAELLEELRA